MFDLFENDEINEGGNLSLSMIGYQCQPSFPLGYWKNQLE